MGALQHLSERHAPRHVCFGVPEDETGIDPFLPIPEEGPGILTAGEPGATASSTLPPAISDTYGTRMAPVPLGDDRARLQRHSIREVDDDKVLEDSDEYFPDPDFGICKFGYRCA